MANGEDNGNLFGKVTDDQGDSLPGVTITLTGSGATQIQITNAEGEFRFLGLEPGSYEVKAELNGFKTAVDPNVEIRLGRDTTIEIKLSLAIEE